MSRLSYYEREPDDCAQDSDAWWAAIDRDAQRADAAKALDDAWGRALLSLWLTGVQPTAERVELMVRQAGGES